MSSPRTQPGPNGRQRRRITKETSAVHFHGREREVATYKCMSCSHLRACATRRAPWACGRGGQGRWLGVKGGRHGSPLILACK